MRWKPISKLTDEMFQDAEMHNRLMLWNSCNGPHHCHGPSDGYFSAFDIQHEGVWTKFLILPDPA